MNYLLDDATPAASPPDTEAFRLGAQRIRELKDSLQTILAQVFNNDRTYKAGGIPGASIANDNGLTAGKLATSAFTDGLLKVNPSDPVTVNVDGTTIEFDASSPKKIRVKDASITSAKIAKRFVGLTAMPTAASPCNVNITFTHGLGATPTLVRWFVQCNSNDAVSGFSAGDQIDATTLASNASSSPTMYANSTTVGYHLVSTVFPYVYTRTGTTDVKVTLTSGAWSIGCVAWIL